MKIKKVLCIILTISLIFGLCIFASACTVNEELIANVLQSNNALSTSAVKNSAIKSSGYNKISRDVEYRNSYANDSGSNGNYYSQVIRSQPRISQGVIYSVTIPDSYPNINTSINTSVGYSANPLPSYTSPISKPETKLISTLYLDDEFSIYNNNFFTLSPDLNHKTGTYKTANVGWASGHLFAGFEQAGKKSNPVYGEEGFSFTASTSGALSVYATRASSGATYANIYVVDEESEIVAVGYCYPELTYVTFNILKPGNYHICSGDSISSINFFGIGWGTYN